MKPSRTSKWDVRRHRSQCHCRACRQRAVSREREYAGLGLESEINRRRRTYVRWLQRALNQILGTRLAVDGVNGRKTRGAVRAFQRRARIKVDGIAGRQTERALLRHGAPAPPSTAGLPSAPPTIAAPSVQALKENIVRLANQEWLRWDRGRKKEGNRSIRRVLQDYWVTGAEAGWVLRKPNWWSNSAWSAAFISWIMKKAGAGSAFEYSPVHAVYTKAAKDNRLANNANPFKAYRITEIKPQVGDLVCKTRARSGTTYDNVRRGRKTHCDIVIKVQPNKLITIGGNVRESVSKTPVTTDANGHINQSRYFAVIRISAPTRTPRPSGTPSSSSSSSSSRPSSRLQGSFGTLAVKAPARHRLTYQFTPEDVLWTARFIVGEAGGKDNAANRAVIWAMFNRYALFIRPSRKYRRVYPTFHQFLRGYSTPLQRCLKSRKAAERNMNKSDWTTCPDGSFYKGTKIRRGQRRRYLELQKRPWSKLPEQARSLAENALKGLIPNPIGNATEFANTRVYYKQAHKKLPSVEQWRRFTERHARQKGWTWIGTVLKLPIRNQMFKNTFFIDKRAKDLPPNTVQVIRPR